MPNCFTLTKKGASEPSSLVQIDAELCALIGAQVHPIEYVCNWFDCIGFALAIGKNYDEIIATIRKDLQDVLKEMAKTGDGLEHAEFLSNRIKMAEYLKENYTPNAWYEHK